MGLVSIDDLQEVTYAASNGHMTDDVKYDVILRASWNHDL